MPHAVVIDILPNNYHGVCFMEPTRISVLVGYFSREFIDHRAIIAIEIGTSFRLNLFSGNDDFLVFQFAVI